jgi:L-ascorbate metabolism protein UlaG (beta-lactamase superfamily)
MKSFGQRASGARLERMQASPRWAGEGFRNLHPVLPGLRNTQAARPGLGDLFCGDGRRWPAGPLPAMDPRPAWLQTPTSGLRATWLGHSTVLLEIDGFRVLTDPVWGPRASPSRLLGPKRFQPVPLPLKALPPLHAVLLSHDHYDHLDMPSVRELAKTGVPWVTALGVGAHLEAFGVAPEHITELDWWEQHPLPGTGLVIHAAPSQHFSGRSLKDRNATLWAGLVVQGPRHQVFFSGDTGLTREYETMGERFGRFDLVMLEVGAHHPSWGDVHLGPHNALQAWQWLSGGGQGGPLLPVHWGTFSLALHDWDEPAEVLLAEGPTQGVPLLMPRLGQAVEPAEQRAAEPWWRAADSTRRGRRSGPSEPSKPPPNEPLAWPLD